MDDLVETTSSSTTSFLEVLELVSLAQTLADRPFKKSIGEVEIVCLHPLTNEGTVDEDYLVIYATGFENCEIWIYKGDVNLISTYERFASLGVKGICIYKIMKIYEMAVESSSLSYP